MAVETGSEEGILEGRLLYDSIVRCTSYDSYGEVGRHALELI
jgi:hypothetical protein